MIKKTVAAAVLLSSVSLFFALPQPLQFLSGFLQVFLLPGLVFSFFFLNGQVSRSDQVLFSVLLSPILVAVLVTAVNLFAGDLFFSIKIMLAACYLLFIAAIILGRPSDTDESGPAVPRLIFIVSFFYAGLILISYLVNNYLLIRSDSWYHATIVREVMTRGIPPKEPLLADFSIKYMWFYHVFLAAWIKLSGLSIFKAMGMFNVVNAFLFPYMIAKYTTYFTGKRYLIVFAALFAIAGLDSASWIFWPVGLIRCFFGEVTGMAEVKRILASTSINGSQVVYFLSPAGTWHVNVSDKFLTVTVFNYSLNLLLACLYFVLSERFLSSSRFKSGVVLVTIIAGTFLFHVVTGITLLFIIFSYTVLMWLASRYIYKGNPPIAGLGLLLISAIVATSIALPYFYSLVTGSGGEGEHEVMHHLFQIAFTSILTILFPLIVLFSPVKSAFKKLFSRKDHVSRTLLYWIFCLLVMCVFINIGTVGEKKLVYFLFMISGPVIFIEIVEKIRATSGAKRVLLVAATGLLFIVPPVLTFRGFMMDRPADPMQSRRYYLDDEEKRFYEWIRDNTSKDSIIIENNSDHLTPVYAQRKNFYSWNSIVTGLGYGGEKLEHYKEIQTSLFGKEAITPELVDSMRKLGMNLYVAVWKGDIESSPWLAGRFDTKPGCFEKVYSSPCCSLYALKR